MSVIRLRQTDRLTDLVLAHGVLRDLDRFYPDFDHWYINKCMLGVLSGRDGLIVAEQGGRIVGAALMKRDEAESKLRCVRVAPEVKSRGVAIHLIDRALRFLDCDRPATSVPEELLHDWSRILVNRFAFSLETVAKGLHRPGRLEYLFNGAGVPETPYGRS